MIPLIRPTVEFDEVADDISSILSSGQLTAGKYVAAFEAAVAAFVGAEHAVSAPSATAALHLSLLAAGIGPGDEVLVSDFSFPASGNVIVQVGATPVFVDCAPGSFVLDLRDAAAKVTSRTAAILPVHAFGQPADLDGLRALAHRHQLAVIEDAACALGSSRGGIACGGRDVGCFSFHPRKIVTTGEGGMVTTNDAGFADRLRTLRNHGGVPAKVGMEFVLNGVNARLGEIPAALGLVQMRRLDQTLEDRRGSALRYDSILHKLPGVQVISEPEGEVWSFQSYVVLLEDSVDRDSVVESMRSAGIETTLGTYAMHLHPAFHRFGPAPDELANSARAQRQSLTLPLLPEMSVSLIERVIEALSVALGSA